MTNHLTWLARWTSLLALGLLASTWPLWVGPAEFPQIPVAASLGSFPLWVDWIGLVGLVVGLCGVLLGNPRLMPLAWTSVLLCGLTLIAFDQHRLQPWVYQLLLFGLIFLLSEPQRTRSLLIGVVVSIYFYSAIGKFDFEFMHTVGQLFWRGMLEIVGRPRADDTEVPIFWIALLPVTELLLAIGLAWHRTRGIAGGLAIGFHLLLMVLLGPLGLNHSWGVVLWNLQFAGQAGILFVWPEIKRHQTTAAPRVPKLQSAPGDTTCGFGQAWGNRLATLIAAGVIVLPAVERLGYWDHWTSWALYAPHSSRVEVWIAGTAVDRLPPALQSMIPSGSTDRLWVRLPLETWSLEETGAPIYPQSRFQMGVALGVARRVDSEFLIRAVVQGVAGRWNGRRQSREYLGRRAIEQAARDLFWLNVQPRKIP